MPTANKSIAQVFEEFLADQEERLSYRTFLKYRNIISLFQLYLESYFPGHDEEYDEVTSDGGTFCSTFIPGDILGGYDEFLGYFMPRKVLCGKETMNAAGTVTTKLAKWLAENGYIEETDGAEQRAAKATLDLPAAQDVLDRLETYVGENAPAHYSDQIEDHFSIKKIEPGKLWLVPLTMYDDLIGPVPVPKQVTQVCGEMWNMSGMVVKTRRGWRLLEIWNVTP